MARSAKKGPYVDQKLLKKVQAQKQAGEKREPIKTWARNSQVAPEFVGHRFSIHTGRDFKEIFIDESMVGHRLGEFAPTRTFRGHGRVVKRILEKT
jgi:small subunit ribosomal protein S19